MTALRSVTSGYLSGSRLAGWALAGAFFALACSSDEGAKNLSGSDGGDTGGSSASNGGASSGGKSTTGSGGDTSAGATGNTGGSNATGGTTTSGGTGNGGRMGKGGRNNAGGSMSGGAMGSGGSMGGNAGGGAGGAAGMSATGWLHTKDGHIYETVNGTDTVWVGRGVNIDDIFFCGVNSMLTMQNPDKSVQTLVSGLISGWKPTFIRIMLAMASNSTTVSWLSNPAQYKTPMVNVINNIGTYPGVYVLVTVRSDSSMIAQDQGNGDPEATGVPSDATTTPDKTKFPQGTDPVYVSLVDDFANAPFVMFGVTNEPAGGTSFGSQKIAAAMDHVVTVIRAEEDKLGVPHHIVAVQGRQWTSDISYYATNPLKQDNVVYEVHGYPPATNSYTYANLPVIIGEYGSLNNANSFFMDLETKQIPSLAFDFDPLNNCAPDLLNITGSVSQLTPSSWGTTVKNYLAMHAK